MSTIIEFRGQFRLVEDDSHRLRKLGKGAWFCRCGARADSVHKNPKCEVCQGGGDCGLDCTLTTLSCPSCGATA